MKVFNVPGYPGLINTEPAQVRAVAETRDITVNLRSGDVQVLELASLLENCDVTCGPTMSETLVALRSLSDWLVMFIPIPT